MRRRILLAFETAERETDPEKLRALMTFVIVGGGPTGAELAGALAEIAHDTLSRDFRNIDPSSARIILVEGGDRVLPAYPAKLSAAAKKMIERLGVSVRTGAMVIDVQKHSVTVREGSATETIPTRTILWAAGVLGSPLGRILAGETGALVDKTGRVSVEPDCSVPGHPEIFIIGDLALFTHQTGKPLPGVAQPAIQQGHYVARTIMRRLRWRTRKAVSLLRQRESGGHRPRRCHRRSELAAHFWVSGVADLDFRPPALHRGVSEPVADFHAVGLVLLHLRPFGTADYRKKSAAARSVGSGRRRFVRRREPFRRESP